jgi:hypothetical protein
MRWREAASKVENRGTGFPAPRCEGPCSQSVSSQGEAKVGPKAVVRNVFAALQQKGKNASNFESLQPLRSNFDWIFYPSPITLLPSCEAVLQPPQWRLQLDATIDFLLQGGFSGACNGISASHKLFAAMMIAIGSVRYRFSAQRNQEQIGVHLAARSWSGQGRLISATE